MYQWRPVANACRDSSAILRHQIISSGGLLGQTLLQIRDPAQVGGLRAQIQGAQLSTPVTAQPSVPAAADAPFRVAGGASTSKTTDPSTWPP